jgi:hypothetical protein
VRAPEKEPERARLLELLRVVQQLAGLAGPRGRIVAALIAAILAALAGYSAPRLLEQAPVLIDPPAIRPGLRP